MDVPKWNYPATDAADVVGGRIDAGGEPVGDVVIDQVRRGGSGDRCAATVLPT